MLQRDFFSRGKELKLAKDTWIRSIEEKTIVKVIREGLVACGIPNWLVTAPLPCPHCSQPGKPKFHQTPAEPGIADLAGVIPPDLCQSGMSPWARPLFIEVKRPVGGREELEQKVFLESKRALGAVAFFARGWDDVAENLWREGILIRPDALKYRPKEGDHGKEGTEVQAQASQCPPGPADQAR